MSRRARQAARQVLERTECHIPVDIRAVTTAYGLVIRDQALEDEVSGMLVVRGERALIGVNADHHEHRRRFTIAHELGHFLLHRDQNSVFIDAFYRDTTSSEGTKKLEIEANAFASELLMPEATVRERVGAQVFGPLNDGAIGHLAEEFNVSVQALTIRLTHLGLLSPS